MEIQTGVGRIVWGTPGKSQIKKDPDTKQPIIRDGKQVEQWVFGVAFPKADFERDIWPGMAQEAAIGYPQGTPPKFSWKYQDGDGIDSNGKPFNTREGYAGCYILTVSTEAFAPPIFKFQNGAFVQLNADQIKTGDYVALSLNLKVNVPTNRAHTPGLYVNPVGINHVGYGPEIHNGPDAETMFGGKQYQLPAGASATPIASGPAMPGAMPQPAPGGYQQPQPTPGGYQQPGAMPPPAPDFTHGATGYPQPGQPAPMPGMPAPGGYQPQPAPGGYQPQPGAMPGMPGTMPPRQ